MCSHTDPTEDRLQARHHRRYRAAESSLRCILVRGPEVNSRYKSERQRFLSFERSARNEKLELVSRLVALMPLLPG